MFFGVIILKIYYHNLSENRQHISRFIITFLITISYKMVSHGYLVIRHNIFTCCHCHSLARRSQQGFLWGWGSWKFSISHICNRGLKSSVFCIQWPPYAHTVTKKYMPTYCNCKSFTINQIFFGIIILILKYYVCLSYFK